MGLGIACEEDEYKGYTETTEKYYVVDLFLKDQEWVDIEVVSAGNSQAGVF